MSTSTSADSTLVRALQRGPAGVCRFCGCSDLDPCQFGCAWADRGRRICSNCVPAAKAEGKQLTALRSSGHRIDAAWLSAYHRGFIVGWFAISRRSPFGRNPFPHGRGARLQAWSMGHHAGVELGRSYRWFIGPIVHRPRASVFLDVPPSTTRMTRRRPRRNVRSR